MQTASSEDFSSAGLCHACANLTIAALRSEHSYLHSKSIWDIEQSARICLFCNLFILAINRGAFDREPKSSQRDAVAKFRRTLFVRGFRLYETLPVSLRFRFYNLEKLLKHDVVVILLTPYANPRSSSVIKALVEEVGVLKLHYSLSGSFPVF